MEDNIISVPQFSADDDLIAQVKAQFEVTGPPPDEVPIPITPPVKRGRGRPRKNPLPPGVVPPAPTPKVEEANYDSLVPGAKLTKREEREVQERLANILIGGTGMASMAKSYLQMTEEEAKAISEPLASYLVRNADTNNVARQILENYDLLAITMATGAYTVRVYRDRVAENAEKRPAKPTLVDRINSARDTSQAGPEVRQSNFVSTPYGSGIEGPSEV